MTAERSVTRRRLLGAVGGVMAGLTGLAGCLRGPGPRPAGDPWQNRADQWAGDDWRLSGDVRLPRGTYLAIPIEPTFDDTAFILGFQGRERLALPFDVLTFQTEDFEAYRSGGEIDPLSSVSSQGAEAAFFEGRLPRGRYVVVIDNTRQGAARPLDEVTIRFELTVTT